MKKWMGTLICLGMILVSVFMITNNYIMLQEGNYSLEEILKKSFIYYSKSEMEYAILDIVNIISYFGSLLFGYIFLIQGLFPASEKYRNMLLIRFQKRKIFIKKFIIKGIVKSLIIVGIIIFSLCTAIWKNLDSFVYSDIDGIHLFLRASNVFLFFNIITIVTLGGYFFLDGGRTLFLNACIIGFLLMIDLFVPFMSILVYGKSLEVEVISIIIQILIYIALVMMIHRTSRLVEW